MIPTSAEAEHMKRLRRSALRGRAARTCCLFALFAVLLLGAARLPVALGTHETGTTFVQGLFETTNEPFDVAIDGEGFFQVIDPTTNDVLYTRVGKLALSSNGILVSDGANTRRVIQPQISIPSDVSGLIITAHGEVWTQRRGQTEFLQIGQLQTVRFRNQGGLLAAGENLYRQTPSSGAPVVDRPGTNGLGTLNQNMLEQLPIRLAKGEPRHE
ncbi:MAG TPA: hypothetical protein VG826_00565 [Pirellulales bacterium]|nr:hypothetical protein [Pirellulales bacterium]